MRPARECLTVRPRTTPRVRAALATPRARRQEKNHDRPTARRDADEALRTKWLQELEALLKGTRTPMGDVSESKLGDKNLLGGGRRASTLRARVRAAKKYLEWLAVAADVSFPSEVSHLTGFLGTRHSEHCNRGALKAAHQCMAFLDSEKSARPNTEASTQVPGGSAGIALTSESTRGGCSSSAGRHSGFADHRGLNPEKDFEVKGNALTARLTCRPNLVAQAGPDF